MPELRITTGEDEDEIVVYGHDVWAIERVSAALALLHHYETTHGDLGEHDHHCHMGWAEPEPPCTCGWTNAEAALESLSKIEMTRQQERNRARHA
jgi:hypothetical protein